MPRLRRAPEPPLFTFRVRLLGGRSAARGAGRVWRDIAVAANQTLRAFGDAIPCAFAFDDPHLWSFFLSGRAWDRRTEYAQQGRAARVRVDAVPFPGADGTGVRTRRGLPLGCVSKWSVLALPQERSQNLESTWRRNAL